MLEGGLWTFKRKISEVFTAPCGRGGGHRSTRVKVDSSLYHFFTIRNDAGKVITTYMKEGGEIIDDKGYRERKRVILRGRRGHHQRLMDDDCVGGLTVLP